jgi:hypothetical protein
MDVLEKKAEIEAMQAELQAEMDRIKEKAEQAEEIERVKKQAQTYLKQDEMRFITKNNWIKSRFSEINNVNVKINEEKETLLRNASSWRIDDNKVLETYTKEVTKLSLVYVNPTTKGKYEIRVDENGGMELPYSVADSYRTYKRISTVVYKIESYIESQNIQTKQRNAQETANDAAVAHLTELYPDSTVKYEKGWVSNYGRRSGGYDAHRVMVFHPNGNVITMNVGYSTEKVFTLYHSSVRFNRELSVYDILDIVK